MNERDLLEFGIYHWVIGAGSTIPGILPTGLPSPDFFAEPKHGRQEEYSARIAEWFDSRLTTWTERSGGPLLILCSGGVDSSSLVATAAAAGARYELLHTAYIDHNNNDLEKLVAVLEHFPSLAQVISIGETQYREGLESLFHGRLLQNTYGPTIAYALSAAHETMDKVLVTGSGPDEFFYGMEKYPFEKFRSLEKFPVAQSLEQLDTAYNLGAYASVLSQRGLGLLQEVLEKRRYLYAGIATLCDSIYDAQRLLAYCTVTSQHMSLFDSLANAQGARHFAPFMDEELIKRVFSIPVRSLIEPDSDERRVEIGKYHLKRFLGRYMPERHVHSKKIGFHAPATSYVSSPAFQLYFENIRDGGLPEFFDAEKVERLLAHRLGPARHEPPTDYFLYSLINVSEYARRHWK